MAVRPTQRGDKQAQNRHVSSVSAAIDPSLVEQTLYLDRPPGSSHQAVPGTKRVVIADCQPVSRRGVASYLEGFEDVEVVGQVSSGDDAVRVAVEEEADVVVMDVEMPEVDGIEATRRIKDKRPDAAVIIFTMHEDCETIIQAIEAGASGFISKSADLSELRNAMDSVRPEGVVLAPKVASQVVAALARGGMRLAAGSRAGRESLTVRERQVATLLTGGLTARAISSRLGISERTVNTHIGSLYRRLRVNNRVDAVREILQLGLPRV